MALEGTADLFPEAAQSPPDLLARARQLFWYHTMRLPGGHVMPGMFDLNEYIPYYLMPPSLRGLRCLDVGTCNGYWALLMEQRGAARVMATDLSDYCFHDYSRRPGMPPPDHSGEGGYGEPLRVAAALHRSRLDYHFCSVYDLSPERVGKHDVVFCGSMLMHIFGPLVALQRMADVCDNAMLVTTETDPTLDGSSLVRYRGHELPYVHFVPGPSALVQMMQCCGFEQVVRGPTFYLEFRDRAKHPNAVCHTACIGLKNVARACIELPPPQPVAVPNRTAHVEILQAPARILPYQSFDVLVRVRNESPAAWRGESGTATALRAGFAVQHVTRAGKIDGWQPAVAATAPLCDYLPAGLATVARLTVQAPGQPGLVRVRPTVLQHGERFQSNDATCEVVVDGGEPVGRPILRKVLGRVLRSIQGGAPARRA